LFAILSSAESSPGSSSLFSDMILAGNVMGVRPETPGPVGRARGAERT
jgi:hypothetical protein